MRDLITAVIDFGVGAHTETMLFATLPRLGEHILFQAQQWRVVKIIHRSFPDPVMIIAAKDGARHDDQ